MNCTKIFLSAFIIVNALGCSTPRSKFTDRVPTSASFSKLALRKISDREFEFSLPEGTKFQLFFLSPTSFHIHNTNKLSDDLKEEFMVVKPDSSRPEVKDILFVEDHGQITTPEMTVNASLVAHNILRLQITNSQGSVVQKWDLITGENGQRSSQLTLEDNEHIYGFGDKRAAIDQKGHSIEILNHDAFASETNDSYRSIPFYMSTKGYGLFFHNYYTGNFDIGETQKDLLSISPAKGNLDFYFFLGNPKQVLSQYTDLTGKPALLPKWSFGFHQSKASYRSTEGLEIAKQMRARKLPFDGIYYDDWNDEIVKPEFSKELWERYHARLLMGGNPMVFAHDTPKLLQDLADHGYTMSFLDGTPALEPAPEAEFDNPNMAYIDFFSEEAAHYAFSNQWTTPHNYGIRMGMWDFAEMDYYKNIPEDTAESRSGTKRMFPSVRQSVTDVRNIYALAYGSRMMDEQLKATGERPTGMVRAGFAGSQRNGWVTTCDSLPTFKNFKAHMRALLNLSMSGFSNTGYDIGGWDGKSSDIIYARWFAAGTFNPFMWAHGKEEHEPYTHGPRVEKLARFFLNLRYKMIPYYYSLHEEAHRTGVPLLRPLALQEPLDSRAPAIDDEFFIGDGLLVAPVLDENERSLYLPKGSWYGFFDDTEKITGPADIQLTSIPWERIPVYVKAGTILTFGPPMNYTSEKKVDPLTIHYYVHSKEDLNSESTSTFSLYEDDGISMNYKQGESARTNIQVTQNSNLISLKIDIESKNKAFPLPPRTYRLKLHGAQLRNASLNGTSLKIEKNEALIPADLKGSEVVVRYTIHPSKPINN